MFWLDGSLWKTRCEFGIATMVRSQKVNNSLEKCKNPGKSCFAVRKEWVNCTEQTSEYLFGTYGLIYIFKMK